MFQEAVLGHRSLFIGRTKNPARIVSVVGEGRFSEGGVCQFSSLFGSYRLISNLKSAGETAKEGVKTALRTIYNSQDMQAT